MTIGEEYLQVSLLAVGSTRVIVSGVPAFIHDENHLQFQICWFGM